MQNEFKDFEVIGNEEQRAKLINLMCKKDLTRNDLILILNTIKPKAEIETLDSKYQPIIQIGTVHTLNL